MTCKSVLAACALSLLLVACGGNTSSDSLAKQTAVSSSAKSALLYRKDFQPLPANLVKSAVYAKPKAGELVANGGFEDGATGWMTSANNIVTEFSDWAHSGNKFAYLGGYDNAADMIAQDFALPASAQSSLQFWYYVRSDETESTASDFMTVDLYSIDSGNKLATLGQVSNLQKNSGWVNQQYDLSAYQGQNVRLMFSASTNASNVSLFVVDDVSLTTAAIVSAGVTPQTGWWWNPAEGGRGFTIEKQGDKIFMAGYLYENDGRATWFGAGPAVVSGSTFSAPLTTYIGGQTLTGAFRAPSSTANNGSISVTFTDPSHGTLSWPGGSIAIERYNIVTNGANASVPAGTPQAGWWWNPAEGGRGYSIEIQNNTMFLAAYMYDDSGNPIWYASGPTAMTNPNTYQGTWQQYGNGQSMNGAYKSASVVNANVGAVTINFNSTTTAILTLPDGKQISIQRYNFGS